MFRATRPYLSEPADPRLFLRKYRFFVGVFIIKVSILKNKSTLPKVFKTVALNTRFILFGIRTTCFAIDLTKISIKQSLFSKCGILINMKTTNKTRVCVGVGHAYIVIYDTLYKNMNTTYLLILTIIYVLNMKKYLL